MENQKIFIGVAWPYVNGNLHIGHAAGYLLPADIFARFCRLLGKDVLMVSGSDCFGTPITIEADKVGKTPAEIVNTYHPKNIRLFNKLGLTFDLYTKTTTDNHQKITQEVLLSFWQKNLLEIKNQMQYYDEAEKRFLPDRYIEGTCPDCQTKGSRSDQCENCGRLHNQDLINPISKLTKNKVTLKKTEHLFIKWDQLQDRVEKYFQIHRQSWRDWVSKETAGWLEKGLKARAVTRDLDWGVEIPAEIAKKLENAPQKRIYVWFEAVIGYLSASMEWAKINNRDWSEFWHNESARHYYFMGKDNLVFHTIFWPAELMVYDEKLHLPDQPWINQFLNFNDQKFSKSRNVMVETEAFIDYFDVNSLRFYLTCIMPESADTNFTWDDFLMKNNDLLVGQIGNYLNRVLAIYSHSENINSNISQKVAKQISQSFTQAIDKLNQGQFKAYIEEILELARFANQLVDNLKPWQLKKENQNQFQLISGDLVSLTLVLALLLQPVVPKATARYFAMIGLTNPVKWPKPNQLTKHLTENLTKIKIGQVAPIFKKIAPEEVTDFNSLKPS